MVAKTPSLTTFDPEFKRWVCGNCDAPLEFPKGFDSEVNQADLSDSGHWVQLNVGGHIFTTTIDTLTKQSGSMFEKMFSGQYKQEKKNGCYMIDRDGRHFEHILNWLRDGFLPLLKPQLYPSLAKEAEYYNLIEMKDAIEEASLQCNADMSRKEVMENLLAGRRVFKGLNLSGQDLSHLDLSKANFSFACLHGANFKGASLRGVELNFCDAFNANFDDCDMRSISLIGGDFTGCSFIGAKWWIPDKQVVHGAKFTSANLTGAYFRGVILANVDFSGADLTGADMSESDLTDANLSDSIVTNAKFAGAKLSDDLRNIVLNGGAMI